MVADGQEIPLSSTALPLGFGVVWTAHSFPFQPSARASKPPVLFLYLPTAVQLVEDTQETPFSRLSVAPLGVAVVWVFHSVPFHASARVTVVPAFLSEPTAVQAIELEHETLRSSVTVAPLGLTVVWVSHSRPFHASAR